MGTKSQTPGIPNIRFEPIYVTHVRASRIIRVFRLSDITFEQVRNGTIHTFVFKWYDIINNIATLSLVNLLLCVQSLWQTHRSGRELGWVALPTVQRQHELSREGFPHYSLCPYGGIHWISLINSTRQGNGSSSWTVRGKRGGPGITVKRK